MKEREALSHKTPKLASDLVEKINTAFVLRAASVFINTIYPKAESRRAKNIQGVLGALSTPQ